MLTQPTVFHDHRQAEMWHKALRGYGTMYTEGYDFRSLKYLIDNC